jgi:uncharacterized protein (DUF1499 family)
MRLLVLRSIAWLAALIVIASVLIVIAGQLGLLKGRAPGSLGVRDGRLKPPSRTPNSVSSQAQMHDAQRYAVDYARIDPLRYSGDGSAALDKLKRTVASMPDVQVIESKPDYLYVQFTTRWLKFVDDTEFWLSPAENVIHVRSASRIGRGDFGVNRARVEAIRARFEAER